MRLLIAGYLVPLLLTVNLPAQSFTTGPCDHDEGNTTNNSWFSGHQERACEVRRATLPLLNGQLNVSGKNGGIEVIGEERQDIYLEARAVKTRRPSRARSPSSPPAPSMPKDQIAGVCRAVAGL